MKRTASSLIAILALLLFVVFGLLKNAWQRSHNKNVDMLSWENISAMLVETAVIAAIVVPLHLLYSHLARPPRSPDRDPGDPEPNE